MLDLFTSTASYSAGSNATASLVASAIPGAANGMQLTTTAVGSGQGISGAKTLASQYNPDTDFGDTIAIMYENDRYASNQVQLEIGRSNVFSGVTYSTNNDDQAVGPKWMAFPKSAWSSMPTGLGAIQLRPRYTTRAPSNAEVKYYACVANAKGKPTLVPTFDDCHRSHYSVLYQWWKDNMPAGAHFTFNVAQDKVNTANCYTTAECQEMDAAGHLAACDGPNDFQFTYWATPELAAAALKTTQDWLVANGMPRGIAYGCYPEGTYMAKATDSNLNPWEKSVRSSTITATGNNIIDAGTLITPNPTGTVIEAGMRMFGGFGANKINGALVEDVTGTTITLASGTVVNAAVTRAVFIKLSDPFTRPLLQNAFRDICGARIFRTTEGGGTSGSAGYLPQFTRFGFAGQALTFPGQGYTRGALTDAQLLANMLADLDKVVAVGGTLMSYLHNIVTGTPAGLDTSMPNVVIPWLQGALARGIDILNMKELDDRDALGYQQLLAA